LYSDLYYIQTPTIVVITRTVIFASQLLKNKIELSTNLHKMYER